MLVIWRANLCHFSGTKSVKTARWRTVCAMSCHLVPPVTHRLRTVHEMCDTHCHTCTLNNYVVTSRDTLEIFWTFQNFCRGMARTISSDPHCHASLRTLSRVVPSMARQIACQGVNRLFVVPVWGLLKSSTWCSSWYQWRMEKFRNRGRTRRRHWPMFFPSPSLTHPPLPSTKIPQPWVWGSAIRVS